MIGEPVDIFGLVHHAEGEAGVAGQPVDKGIAECRCGGKKTTAQWRFVEV